MARRGSSKRAGPNGLQIITWVIILLVVVSMVLVALPVGQQ